MSKARKVKGHGKTPKKAAPKPKAKPKVHKFAGKKPSSRLVTAPRKEAPTKAEPRESPHIHKFAKAGPVPEPEPDLELPAKTETRAAPPAYDPDEIPSAKDPIERRDIRSAAASATTSVKPPMPKGMAARLAAMAAAAADEAEPEVAARKPSPKGGVAWQEDEEIPSAKEARATPAPPPAGPPRGTRIEVDDDGPATMAPVKASAPAAVADGIEVVAKGPSKFSAADLELLRSSIKVKGSAAVIEGINFEELKWDSEGLLPVVAQDRRTGAVLMLAWTNKETLEATLKTKQMTYWSRSRNKVWQKGEESGHVQRMVKLSVDCDKDSILALVDQEGPACHRDTGTCWNEERAAPLAGFLGELDGIIAGYAKTPNGESYTSKLLANPRLALEKLVEEVNETLRVLQGKPNKDPLEHEAADLLYHLLVACRMKGVGLDKVLTELYSRHLAAQIAKK